jgi:glycosyltransferase involved in cell wall biosynthesis
MRSSPVPAPSLSVVIPVHNGQGWVTSCIEQVVAAIDEAQWPAAEFVVVDDGSTDDTVQEVKAIDLGRRGFDLHVISQPNAGRLKARRAGLEIAQHPCVLFIDVRVALDRSSLAFVAPYLAEEATSVWTAHVEANTDRSPIAGFWQAIEHVAWRRYFRHPQMMSYGIEEFDFFPKGTTALLGPRALFLQAFDAYRPTVDDWRISNDDTAVLRWVASHRPINIAPEYRAVYNSRTTIKEFLGHARHRGAVLIDGYLRPGARFSEAIAGVLLLTPGVVVAAVRWPRAVMPAAVAVSVGAGVGVRLAGARRHDAVVVGALAVPFGANYLVGMWRGVAARLRTRSRGGAPAA